MNMKTSTLFLLSTISINLLFVGCGEGHKNNSTEIGSIGNAAAIVTTEDNPTMVPSPSTLNSITYKLAGILQEDVQSQNKKEATSFTKETRYCEISGMKESNNQRNIECITKTEKFSHCKTAPQQIQNGLLQIDYRKMNSDGKFPKELNLTVMSDYSCNDLLLKKGTTISSKVYYKANHTVKSIKLTVSGTVTYQYGTYALKEQHKTVNY